MENALVFLRPGRRTFPADATEAELAVVQKHFDYLLTLARRGDVLLAGRTDGSLPLGIVIVRGTAMQAQEILRDDAAVQARLLIPEVHPFRLAIDGEAIRRMEGVNRSEER